MMKEIRLKISDLFEIDPQIKDRPKGLVEITAYVLKHYAFLPMPIAVMLQGDGVVISSTCFTPREFRASDTYKRHARSCPL
jgi:hypothetical protein